MSEKELMKEIQKLVKEVKEVKEANQATAAQQSFGPPSTRDGPQPNPGYRTPKRNRSPSNSDTSVKRVNDMATPSKSSEGGKNHMDESAPTPSGSAPVNAGASAAGAEGTEVSDKTVSDYELTNMSAIVDNLDLQDFENDAYAKMVKKNREKRVKQVFPYCLFILGGTEGKSRITKKHWDAYLAFVRKEHEKLSDEDYVKIEIDFFRCPDGLGMMGCLDKLTANWVKTITSKFVFENQLTRAWARWERDSALIFQGYLHGSDLKNVKPNLFLGQALKRNRIEGEFKNANFDTKSDKNGVWLTFEPSPVLANNIQKRKMVFRVSGGNKLRLEGRIRRQRTEEEFVKFMEEQNEKFRNEAEKKAAEEEQRATMNSVMEMAEGPK